MSIQDLKPTEIPKIFERARSIKDDYFAKREASPSHFQKATALIFLENSTRTRISFTRACQIISKPFVQFPDKSSLSKGESFEDTLANLESLECDQLVIRCTEENLLQRVAQSSPLSIINGGDGTREHPTQALLDLFTLWMGPAGGSLEKLKKLHIGIMGDLLHSRVARSWGRLAAALDLKVQFFSPEEWRPKTWDFAHEWQPDLDPYLKDLDAVMSLRVQKERFDEQEVRRDSVTAFSKKFQLTEEKLNQSGKPWLLHPGPVNWGIELSEELRSYKKSLILDQVQGGVFLRAAVIELFSKEGASK